MIRRRPEYWRSHAVLGAVLTCQWQLDDAGQAFKAAMRLDERRTELFGWLAAYFLTVDQRNDALSVTYFNVQRNLDDPVVRAIQGFFLYVLRRFETAEKVLDASIKLDLNCWFARLSISLLYFSIDRPDDALKQFQHMQWLTGAEYGFMPGLCYLYAKRARNIKTTQLNFLLELSRKNISALPADWIQVALAHMADDNKQDAVEALQNARNESNPLAWWLHLWPIFDSLRGYPGFEDLLVDMNLPKS